MVWFNLVTPAILLPKVKKVYDHYMAQRKTGAEAPYFDPDRFGIKNCEIWTEINKNRIHADKAI